jgi:hypothetical protein
MAFDGITSRAATAGRGVEKGQFPANQPMAVDSNFSISSIKTEKLGRSKRISGAGIRLCLILGGRCL